MKKHRWCVTTMNDRLDTRTKSKILSAWKFLVDFSYIQEHKMYNIECRKARAYTKDGFARWCDQVAYARKIRGVVLRTHRYHAQRKLAQAMDDWEFAVSISRKERILEQAQMGYQDDPMELARTMDAYVASVVSKPRVRPYELQAAAA